MEANEVYAILKNLIKKNSGATDEQIKQAVEEYLIKNPVSVETDKTLSKMEFRRIQKPQGMR